ncbi:hypothetical protein FGB62_100g07 [Gracilaria domingensis]|nr:hypothetical protein FGB62_100g07 [Gracilaria domingensis]
MESYRNRNTAERDFQVSITRWTPAFVALLALSSGGQSLQSLAQIQVSRLRDLRDILRRAGKVGFISLPTMKGSRTMLVGTPEVILPVSCATFLQFHVSVILPPVDAVTQPGPHRKSAIRLLVNQESGAPMRSQKVAYELKKFMRKLDCRYANITCTRLRLSCMKIFLSAFRDGSLLDHLNEAQLVDLIARHYNTYDGQVRKNLGHRGSADHGARANELTRFLFRVSTGEMQQWPCDERLAMTAGSGSGDGDRLMTVDCSARHCAEIKPRFRSSWWCGRGGSGRWLRIGVEFGMSVETVGSVATLTLFFRLAMVGMEVLVGYEWPTTIGIECSSERSKKSVIGSVVEGGFGVRDVGECMAEEVKVVEWAAAKVEEGKTLAVIRVEIRESWTECEICCASRWRGCR